MNASWIDRMRFGFPCADRFKGEIIHWNMIRWLVEGLIDWLSVFQCCVTSSGILVELKTLR